MNKQPSSGGTVTLTLPKATGAGHALIVGVSFWPLDLKSVTDSSGDSFSRGITTSIYHNVSQGVMYTNFYYARNTAGGATTITLTFQWRQHLYGCRGLRSCRARSFGSAGQLRLSRIAELHDALVFGGALDCFR